MKVTDWKDNDMGSAPRTDLAGPFGSSAFPETRGGILIASDGRTDADAAVIIGRAVAERDDSGYSLLAVREQPTLLDAAAIGPSDHTAVDRAMMIELRERLEEQRWRTSASTHPWPLTMTSGQVASAIVDMAKAGRHRLIVLGLHDHSHVDRLLGRETALRVIRLSPVPVFAMDAHRRTIPRRALVAVDFGASSVAAAREALRVVGATGPVYLAHVTPRIPIPLGGDAADSYGRSTLDMLGALRRELDVPRGVDVRCVNLRGDPVRELLAFAKQYSIELIAAGYHGRSVVARTLLGSVTTDLVRAAQCSVLVAPPVRGQGVRGER